MLAGGAWVSQLVLQPTLDPTTHVLSACWQPWLLKGKKKWFLPALSSFLFLSSVAVTSCFLWQCHPPKLQTAE